MNESYDNDTAFVRRQLKASPNDNALRHKLAAIKARVGDTTLQDKANRKFDRFHKRSTLRPTPTTNTPVDDVRRNLMNSGNSILAARGGKLSLEKQHPDEETRPTNIQQAIDYYAQAKNRYRKALGYLNKGKRNWNATSGHHNLEPDMKKYYTHKQYADAELKKAEKVLKTGN